VEDGKMGLEYKIKIEKLKADKAERFLYQEFVRSKHAERIKVWIHGIKNDYWGSCEKIIDEIDKLLNPVDKLFKRDLGLICESHHLPDLDDFGKYKTSQAYGTSRQEEVNLQYAAVMLRTADLLHITSDRTPTIEFNLINPSDPVSQGEWYKQMAVKSVRPKLQKDKDGNIDDKIPPDTIEVNAYFDEPNQANSFFALISYLRYARGEIVKSYEWIEKSKKTQGSKYCFPWKNIDDSNIETYGFERKLFEFKLDQPNILKLLVGHTLYNDTLCLFYVKSIYVKSHIIVVKKVELDRRNEYI